MTQQIRMRRYIPLLLTAPVTRSYILNTNLKTSLEITQTQDKFGCTKHYSGPMKCNDNQIFNIYLELRGKNRFDISSADKGQSWILICLTSIFKVIYIFNGWRHMWYGFFCGSAIIIWNNSALFPRITCQPTWNQHTQSDSDHRCHIPAFTSHGQTHQRSPRHSWIGLTEIDLFCYGPVNPLRKAAIIMERSHMGDSNPNVKHSSARRDHSDHMTVRICSAQQHSDHRNWDH